nr:unnamed protein product [Digitaria exilis]
MELRETKIRRAIWERERPSSSRFFSTLAQRILGSAATTAAMSARERPRAERKATTASGWEGDLRWETAFDALRACARVRPHLATR